MNTCIEVNNDIDSVPDNIHGIVQSLIILNNNKIKKIENNITFNYEKQMIDTF